MIFESWTTSLTGRKWHSYQRGFSQQLLFGTYLATSVLHMGAYSIIQLMVLVSFFKQHTT